MVISLPLWVMLLYTRRLPESEIGQAERHASNIIPMTRAGQIMPARQWHQGTQEIKFIQVFNRRPVPGATTRR